MKFKNLLTLLGVSSLITGLATPSIVFGAETADKVTVFQSIQLSEGSFLNQTITTNPEAANQVVTSIVAGSDESQGELTAVEKGQTLFPGFSGYDRSKFVKFLTTDLEGKDKKRVIKIHNKFQKLSKNRVSNALQRVDERFQGMKMFNLGATDIDGGRSSLELDSVWSTDQVALLEKAQRRATGIRNRSMNYYEANKILINGLRKALRNEIELAQDGSEEPTFLQTALARGIEIIEDLEILNVRHQQNTRSVDNRAFYQLLQRQIEFLVEDVALNLDLGVNSQVYVNPHDMEPGFLELRFEDYAYAQLNWVNKYLAKSRIISNGEQIVTGMGGSDKYLKTAEYTLVNVAEDLFYSPWAKQHAHIISEMLEHFEALSKYNNGERGEFFDDVEANRQTYQLIEHALDSIERQQQ